MIPLPALLAILSILISSILGFTFKIPPNGYKFTPGQPTTLNWVPSSNTKITLQLQSVDSSSHPVVYTITGKEFHDKNGTLNIGAYTWTVPTNIASDSDYVISIMDNQDPSDYAVTPSFAMNGTASLASVSSASSVTPTLPTSAPTTALTDIPAGSAASTSTTTTTSLPAKQTNSEYVTQDAVAGTAQAIPSSSPGPSSSGYPSAKTDTTSSLQASKEKVIIPVVVLGALLIFAIILFVPLRRRWLRKSTRTLKEENPNGPDASTATIDNQTHSQDLWHMKAELSGSGPKIVPEMVLPVELPACEPVVKNDPPDEAEIQEQEVSPVHRS